MKHVTVLRHNTTATTDILRRFTRANLQHLTYKALVELGNVLRMALLNRCLRQMELGAMSTRG